MNLNDTCSCIYAIINTIDDKMYVGSALNKKERFREHGRKLRYGSHTNKHLQSAYNKYGKDVFIYCLLEKVNDLTKLYVKEQHWITILDSFKSGYNRRPTANNMFGFKHSPETIIKFKTKPFTDIARKRMSEARKGIRMSEAAKAKMIAKQRLKRCSEETKAKMRLGWEKRRKPLILDASKAIALCK